MSRSRVDTDDYVGEIRLFAGPYAPEGWAICDGSLVSGHDYDYLKAMTGAFWGETATGLRLPDLRGMVPICQGAGEGLTPRRMGETLGHETEVAELAAHSHAMRASTLEANSVNPHGKMLARVVPTSAVRGLYLPGTAPNRTQAEFTLESVTSEGGNAHHDNSMPSMALNYIISLTGATPDFSGDGNPEIRDLPPITGEIRCFAFGSDRGPAEWIPCDGRVLSQDTHPNLYGVISTTFGEAGPRQFRVPDLRGRVAVGANAPLTQRQVGDTWGSDQVALTVDQMPRHNHAMLGGFVSNAAQLVNEPPQGGVISRSSGQFNYVQGAPQRRVNLHEATLEPSGAGQPHENRQPFLALAYYICWKGEFPRRPD